MDPNQNYFGQDFELYHQPIDFRWKKTGRRGCGFGHPPVFQDPPLSAHKQPGVPKLCHFVQGPMLVEERCAIV